MALYEKTFLTQCEHCFQVARQSVVSLAALYNQMQALRLPKGMLQYLFYAETIKMKMQLGKDISISCSYLPPYKYKVTIAKKEKRKKEDVRERTFSSLKEVLAEWTGLGSQIIVESQIREDFRVYINPAIHPMCRFHSHINQIKEIIRVDDLYEELEKIVIKIQ